MSGRNVKAIDWPEDGVLERGFVLRRKPRGCHEERVVFRPDRGSGGFSLWADRRRAEAECDDGEVVVEVLLRMELA